MILTVTLNPLLERRLDFEKLEPGKNNRAEREYFRAGGKGINVSRQLNLLNVKNTALTFIGGNNGKIFRRIIEEERILPVYVNMKSELRWATVAFEKTGERLTTLFAPNHYVSEREAAEFEKRMERMIANCSIVVFAGSSPHPNTDYLFARGVEIAHEHDKISVVDTYGNALKLALEKAPTVIHNNIEELKSTLNIELKTEKEKRHFLYSLYEKGIKMAFLTNGKNTVYASKFDFHYKISPPKIHEKDATGSGDAFVAGIASGLENGLTFDEFTRKAISLGAANAESFETCSVSPEEYGKFLSCLTLKTVGKKMKLIDDSPTI